MPDDLMQHLTQDTHYVVWVIPGAWWIVCDDDTVLFPDCPPPWPAPCTN